MTHASRPRWLLPILVVVLLGGLVGGGGLLYFLLGGEAPPPASILPTPSPAASAGATPGSSDASGLPSESPASDGIDGEWAIDASVGSFADFSGTWAGFRVDEVLGQGIGSATAVGRTPGVEGALSIAGSRLTAVDIGVDLTRIVSDKTRRDDAIQRTLDTRTFPTATFALTAPLELGEGAADGRTLTLTAAGRLTIHGVTRDVIVELGARLGDGRILVVGTTPFAFSDYGMTAPTAPIVLSVANDGTLEFQLFFSRQG